MSLFKASSGDFHFFKISDKRVFLFSKFRETDLMILEEIMDSVCFVVLIFELLPCISKANFKSFFNSSILEGIFEPILMCFILLGKWFKTGSIMVSSPKITATFFDLPLFRTKSISPISFACPIDFVASTILIVLGPLNSSEIQLNEFFI